jgi:hypothetical protein
MSKRKATKASKQARSKVAAKAQRASEAVVRSRRHLRLVAPASTKPSPMLHSKPDAAVLEEAKIAIAAPEKPTIASQDDSQRTMSENDITKAWNVFSPTANIGGYQTMLSEAAAAYMKLAFESAQRLARIKSPLEIPGLFRDEATRDLPKFDCSQPEFAMRASDRRKVITSMMARVGARRSPLAQDDQAASRRCSGADMGSGAGLNVWTPLSQ